MMRTMIVGSTLFLDSSDYLEHHGVKGQKWGIRRYQDESGHLTAKGRKKLEKKLVKLKRKKTLNDTRLGAMEETRFRKTAASATLGAIAGAAVAAVIATSTGGIATPVAAAAGAAVCGAIEGGAMYAGTTTSMLYQGHKVRKINKKVKAYEDALKEG